jgi:hypothetical protein
VAVIVGKGSVRFEEVIRTVKNEGILSINKLIVMRGEV